jgi:hypothetical protein
MRRRNFLYNTGLLLPALLASPSLVTAASTKTITTPLLIIQNDVTMPGAVAAALNEMAGAAPTIDHKTISSLTYTKNGFRVVTTNNTTFVAEKLLVHSLHRINSLQSLVEVTLGHQTFPLAYLTDTANKITPECWFAKTNRFKPESLTPFINRNRHAVLCIS